MKATIKYLAFSILVVIMFFNVSIVMNEGVNVNLESFITMANAVGESDGTVKAEKKVTTLIVQSETEELENCRQRIRTRSAAEDSCPGNGSTNCKKAVRGTGSWSSWVYSNIPGCMMA